jgi:catechol 2,3-dioxygenase-like lactoylglutathione lyase family enzyme
MKVAGINHINIVVTAEQLPVVTAFYEQVLGLHQGFRTVSKRNGAWLYGGEQAIIHLSEVVDQPATSINSYFNHVAFSCSGLEAALERLANHQVDYSMEYRTPPGMTQLFFYDPVGIRIELNFAGEKVA